MDRFRRTEQLLGKENFQTLQSKRVTVVGLWAVGGYVLEGLARAGVQHLRIVDFGTIQTGNINRQIIVLESTLSRSKEEDTKVEEIPFSDRGRARNLFGRPSTITGIFGLTIANLAIFQLIKNNKRM